MARVYKSCIKCGYLYDYNAYCICPECGTKQVNIQEIDKDDNDINKK